ncbi:MAG TPA: histidine phosphatase family protein [Caulobacteraceae bacterium]|nr:histidine phosphatase family protein [Caulobacteraceae bacterium]
MSESRAAAGSAAAADKAERPGAIILARHGEPALSRKVRLSAQGYRAWWAKYEAGGIRSDQEIPAQILAMAGKAGFIIASTRARSIETAKALARGRAVAEDPMFIEAPLPPPNLPSWLRLSPRAWGFVSRISWWFFHGHGEESRPTAQERADEAARQLADLAVGGHDVLVVAHGFFNSMVGRSLRRRGWRLTLDQGFRYWSARRFEANPSA